MKQNLEKLISFVLSGMGYTDIVVFVSQTENEDNGDYTTPVAMAVAKQKKINPIALANEIVGVITTAQKARTAKLLSHSTDQTGQTLSEAENKIEDFSVLDDIYRIEVAKPGFINIILSEATLITQSYQVLNFIQSVRMGQKTEDRKQKVESRKPSFAKDSEGQAEKNRPSKIMVEFAHPNTHKAFHIGHLRNITTGECIVRLLESQGHEVIRVNYQGDVGLHIAKCLYGIQRTPACRRGRENRKQRTENLSFDISHLSSLPIRERINFLAKAYVAGNQAYESDENAKKEIEDINKKIYAKDPSVLPLYQETRKWSLDYFDGIYTRVGTHFDRLYFESEVFESGKKAVLEGMKKKVFEESEGAIIFPGEQFGLHNRVFITSQGMPTYEGKDMGLVKLQWDEYHPDTIIHCVASEQTEYFRVIFSAIEKIYPELIGKEQHLVYGWVRLKEGKMSSRSGNVVLGEWLLDEVKKEIASIVDKNVLKVSDVNVSKASQVSQESNEKSSDTSDISDTFDSSSRDSISEACAIAAVKYAFLKIGTRQEIAFDIKESVNVNGDSGPYLLYTYARAKSVLRKGEESIKVSRQVKATHADALTPSDALMHDCNPEERSILRLVSYFPDVVSDAAENYAPNTLCTYLFRLSQAFNLFYAKYPILTDDSAFRLRLTHTVSEVLHYGLYLLGIASVERM